MPLRLTRWALAASAAAAPLYVVRWHAGPLPTTLLENLILITFLLYALQLVLHRKPLPARTPYDIPIAVMLVAGVIGIFVASDHRGALGIFRAYLIEPIVIFYIAVAVLETDRDVLSLIGAWAVGAILFVFVQLATVAAHFSEHSFDPDNAPAAFGINANSVSLYFDPLIGVALGFVLFARGAVRWAAAVTLAMLLVGDVSTLSRGGLLAIGVLVLIAVATQRWWVQVVFIGLGIGGVLVLTHLPVLGPRILRALNPAWGTFVGRGRIWAATARMLRDHPVFGAGLNGYQTTMAPYRLADSNLRPEPYPHDIFLTFWTELGLLGLAAFTYILLNLLIRPWRAIRRADETQRPLLWGVASAMAMILAHGLVDSPYWKNDLSIEFWLLAALEVIAIVAVARRPGARETTVAVPVASRPVEAA